MALHRRNTGYAMSGRATRGIHELAEALLERLDELGVVWRGGRLLERLVEAGLELPRVGQAVACTRGRGPPGSHFASTFSMYFSMADPFLIVADDLHGENSPSSTMSHSLSALNLA